MNWRKISTTTLICISGLAFGQESGIHSEAIKINFSEKSIEAYQKSSQKKLSEFYEYLTLYSNENNAELKNQIRENVFSLAEPEMKLPDFTQSTPAEIGLDEFLAKIENQSWQFKIKSSQHPGEAGLNHWVNPYILSVSRNGKTSDFEVNQTIYFEPKEKQFGSKTKTVWEVKLGDIQQ